ncbi:MAG: HlyC/CorC family transporter [Atopobiaceae bacterium]|nr:HlyC/CorC family transporter [Atopobiaceae bacterium]
MDIAISIIVTFLLTLANGFFSASEMAVVNAKRAILEPEADEGDSRAKQALELANDSNQFLATIQVAITLVGFAASAFAATSLSGPFGAFLARYGIPAANAVATVIITLIVSYFSIVIGELVPKRITLADAEGVAKFVAGPVRAFMTIAKPLVWATSSSAEALSSLLGIANPDDRQGASEDEIKYMVTDADDLTEEEKSMIHDVMDLGDTVAREVMIPRVDMTTVEDTDSLREVLDVMRKTGHSRVPVYHGTVDKIVGIAHIKDLLAPILDQRAETDKVNRYMRSCRYVPDTKDIMPLLSEMQSNHEQMVIVVDEYGGTAGVITIEDIVEEVVGEIEDEFDPDNKYLTQLNDREWLVDGRFSIDDAIEMGWPIEDSDEYETLAGFVLELADKLPRPGDTFEQDGYTFTVQSMRGRRVTLVRVTAPEPKSDEDQDEDD